MAAATTQTEGVTLRLWLCLLGWRVQTDRDGRFAVGIASHLQADGTTVRVAGCARSDCELALQLFEAAMRALDRSRHTNKQLAPA
jgi:hypothetical protein